MLINIYSKQREKQINKKPNKHLDVDNKTSIYRKTLKTFKIKKYKIKYLMHQSIISLIMSLKIQNNKTHTHTHIYIYIYIYI